MIEPRTPTPTPMAPLALDPGSRRWTVSPQNATLTFAVPKLGGTARGRFGAFRGAVEWQPGGQPRVTAEIEVASIDTGIRRRDEHLRSADFFDAAGHPSATFASAGWEPGAGASGRMPGTLTLRGITRPFALETRLEVGLDGELAFTARGEFDRFDFGIAWGPRAILVGRRVTVLVEGRSAG